MRSTSEPGIPRPSCMRLDALHSAWQGWLRQARSLPRSRRAICSAPNSTCLPKAAAPERPNELSARNGNVAVAVVYAALRSIEQHGKAVRIADVIAMCTAVAARNREGKLKPPPIAQSLFRRSDTARDRGAAQEKPAGHSAMPEASSSTARICRRARTRSLPTSSRTPLPNAWTAWFYRRPRSALPLCICRSRARSR